jgi:hypothetical protein
VRLHCQLDAKRRAPANSAAHVARHANHTHIDVVLPTPSSCWHGGCAWDVQSSFAMPRMQRLHKCHAWLQLEAFRAKKKNAKASPAGPFLPADAADSASPAILAPLQPSPAQYSSQLVFTTAAGPALESTPQGTDFFEQAYEQAQRHSDADTPAATEQVAAHVAGGQMPHDGGVPASWLDDRVPVQARPSVQPAEYPPSDAHVPSWLDDDELRPATGSAPLATEAAAAQHTVPSEVTYSAPGRDFVSAHSRAVEDPAAATTMQADSWLSAAAAVASSAGVVPAPSGQADTALPAWQRSGVGASEAVASLHEPALPGYSAPSSRAAEHDVPQRGTLTAPSTTSGRLAAGQSDEALQYRPLASQARCARCLCVRNSSQRPVRATC